MILSDVDYNLGLPTMFTWDGRTTPLYIIKYAIAVSTAKHMIAIILHVRNLD